jgi:hypothetical protein
MEPMLILLAAASQAAQAPAPSAPLATELPEVKVTCRTERVTGSRMVKRVCRTAEQQRQADLQARDKLKMGSHNQTTEAFKAPTGQ